MVFFKACLLLEILFLFWAAFVRNKDLFSPAKVYLVFSTFFFAAVFATEVMWETFACYFLLIQSIALCLVLEQRRGAGAVMPQEFDRAFFYKVIWCASVPAVATMAYFVYEAGGILQHLLSLALRVESWRGKGYLLVMLNTMPTLCLLYFAVLVSDRQRTRKALLLFALYFLVFFCVGLLTASRSYIATPILGMCMVWSYLVRAPKLAYVAAIGSVLVILVITIGVVRNNGYGGEAGEGFFDDNTGRNNLAHSQMAYGIMPLEIIFTADEKKPLLGATYLTLVSNFIPRNLWPTKPDTGGIIFTRAYTDDQSGLSYMATGAVTEGVMNFGKGLGVAFGVFANLFALIAGTVLYNRGISAPLQERRPANIIAVVVYFYTVLTFARFSYGEFTDIFQTLLFYNILPLMLVARFMRPARHAKKSLPIL
jgi:hypothetical protein